MGKDKRVLKSKCKNTAAELKEIDEAKTGRFYIFVEQGKVKDVGSFTGYITALSPTSYKPGVLRFSTVPNLENAIYFETVLSLRMFVDVAMERQKCVKSYKIVRLPL